MLQLVNMLQLGSLAAQQLTSNAKIGQALSACIPCSASVQGLCLLHLCLHGRDWVSLHLTPVLRMLCQ